ncbi:16S rRNA (uracil(1498)-N(3))-methyltransferase [Eubacterium sp. AF22-8LB]|uniref:RsmE family RNA methyltransferase n=1 Tax=Eubacterium sp. AF22-8LB TaxID=2292232 RepID=UPI000E547ECA|nr:RsmE family RNA methyltransferase [Eubacterium sp. AF22-8LB]RGS30606.1 16S rRNA (uracil(1498)-N(3))-methyltransferase [Eubacterium sp. AF22-8LB]
MKQVYLDQIINVNDTLALDSKQAHHIFDVLRTSSKEKIRIVTKSSGVFYGHVLDKPKLHIDEKLDVLKEHQSITLCCALIKQDKFEWMLQKACELGVSKIVPFVSKNTVVKLDEKKAEKKLVRWNEILLAATKQCNRNTLVELESVVSLKDLVNYKSECNVVAYEKESDPSKHMAHYLQSNPYSITVCIGPEGGFEESEIKVLNDFGFENCSLGKNILRAETAACYVLSAIEYQNHVEG